MQCSCYTQVWCGLVCFVSWVYQYPYIGAWRVPHFLFYTITILSKYFPSFFIPLNHSTWKYSANYQTIKSIRKYSFPNMGKTNI